MWQIKQLANGWIKCPYAPLVIDHQYTLTDAVQRGLQQIVHDHFTLKNREILWIGSRLGVFFHSCKDSVILTVND